jgi:hypothetical protein
MGCDIHFFVERVSIAHKRNQSINEIIDEKDIQDKLEWNLVSEDDDFYSSRNYDIFGILANVRREHPAGPIKELMGFPNDASENLKIIYKRCWDAHSPSYLTLRELLQVDWAKYTDVYLDEFMNCIERMKEIDTNTDNVRCVFWFDN